MMGAMRLLVVSHACCTAINQSFYADLEAETGCLVSLVIPSRWSNQYGITDTSARWHGLQGDIKRINVFRPGNIPTHLYRSWFISLLRQQKPDAIYVHQEPYGLSTFQLCLANYLTGNGPIGFYAAQNILKAYPSPIRQMEKWVFQRSCFALPVTKSALDVLRAKGYRHTAEVLPLAIDPGLYHPNPDWRAQQRAKLGISPDRFVLGYVGRLVEEKGLDTLLVALDQLKRVPWELLLIGSGPFAAALRQKVDHMQDGHGRVRFVGYVPHEETPRWLSTFDVLVLPSETTHSWKEQFGRVLVEAMACGTPVIGSSSGEIPNVINATGGGLIFPEQDADALAQNLNLLAESPGLRRNLIEQGQRSVAELYDQRHLVRKFASVIEGVISSHNRVDT
jgi:glycosyltransferase involved in cell wall biosynthesis